MRIAALVAVLVAGCRMLAPRQRPVGAATDHRGQTPTTTGPSGSKPPAPSAAPAAGRRDLRRHRVDRGRSSRRSGPLSQPRRATASPRRSVTTSPSPRRRGKVACMTDSKHTGGALACLVDLTNPPPRPETAYGEWKGGWVDFDGTNLQVGSARGDPGPFVNGNGPELANGDSLSFGDYRCRADQAGLFCVNYAHQSAVRFSTAGIEPFGCLRSVPPPDGVGTAFALLSAARGLSRP